jgi:HSP20 family molecular chaperone IbpA
VFDAIDRFINDDFSQLFNFLGHDVPRQVRAIQTGGFPPTNISVDDQKQFTIEVALAGIPRDKINIDFQNRVVTLSVNNMTTETDDSTEEEETRVSSPGGALTRKVDDNKLWIQRGIKRQQVIENQWTIPERFDIEKAKAEYKDGLLTLTFPLNEKEERLLEKRVIKLLE